MRRLPLVDRLRVREPCEVGWDNMEDLGTHRHCAKCESTVHDVSAMTRAEVETLLEARERGERVCLHLHVRKTDGAVLVADGFVERRGRLAPPSRLVAAAMATATAMSACATATSPPRDPQNEIAVAPVAPTPIETASPPPPPAPAVPPDPPPLPAPPPPAQDDPPPLVTTPVKPSRGAKPIAAKPPKKVSTPAPQPPKKPPHLDIIDGGAW